MTMPTTQAIEPIAEALPTWYESKDAVKAGAATPLHEFIYANEPAGSDEEAFREQLANLIAHVRQQVRNAALEEAAKLFEEVVSMCGEVPHPVCPYCVQDAPDAPIRCVYPDGDFRWEHGPVIAVAIRALSQPRQPAEQE